MRLLAELAVAINRSEAASQLETQAMHTETSMLSHMYNASTGLWCDGICARNASSTFHAQHFPLWLGVTPPSGVAAAVAYISEQGMVGSTYSAFSVLHGLYRGAAV